MRQRIIHSAFAALLTLGLASAAAAEEENGELTLHIAENAPPDEIADEIKETLRKESIQLRNGDEPVYEFWLRKEVPLEAKPEKPADAIDELAETTLLGVMVMHKKRRDYRDDELYKDVYTMRYGLQPQDGNHLGTSLYRHFAVLLPASEDTAVEAAFSRDEMVDISLNNTAVGHPIILALWPPLKTDGDYPSINEPTEDHKSVQVQVPAKAGGEDTILTYEIVYKGVGEI